MCIDWDTFRPFRTWKPLFHLVCAALLWLVLYIWIYIIECDEMSPLSFRLQKVLGVLRYLERNSFLLNFQHCQRGPNLSKKKWVPLSNYTCLDDMHSSSDVLLVTVSIIRGISLQENYVVLWHWQIQNGHKSPKLQTLPVFAKNSFFSPSAWFSE